MFNFITVSFLNDTFLISLYKCLQSKFYLPGFAMVLFQGWSFTVTHEKNETKNKSSQGNLAKSTTWNNKTDSVFIGTEKAIVCKKNSLSHNLDYEQCLFVY